MSYWKEEYPEKIGNHDFVDGVIAGIYFYVGIYGASLDGVIKEVKDDLLYKGENI